MKRKSYVHISLALEMGIYTIWAIISKSQQLLGPNVYVC